MSKMSAIRRALRGALGRSGSAVAKKAARKSSGAGTAAALLGGASAVGAASGAAIGESSEREHRNSRKWEGAVEGAKEGAKLGLVTVPGAIGGAASGVFPLAGGAIVAHVLGTGTAAGKKREGRERRYADMARQLRKSGATLDQTTATLKAAGAKGADISIAIDQAFAAEARRPARTGNAGPVSAVKKS